MSMVRAMRMLNAIEAGTLSGAQLETLLTADPGRLAEFNVLLGMRGQARRMVASSTAMTAVWASNTASDAVLTSATARLAVYNADTALAALQANPAQVQRQIGISGRTTTQSTAAQSFTYVANGTRVILLRAWLSGNDDMALQWGRGLITDNVAGGLRLPNGDNLAVTTAAIGRTTTYANSGTFPNANNANANVVSAANGLRRRTWTVAGNTTQSVIYITV